METSSGQDQNQSWSETDSHGAVTGTWQLDSEQGGKLSGTWRKPGGAGPPIRLTRTAGGDCSSDAFNAKMERAPEIVTSNASFEGHAYREITVSAPKGTDIDRLEL